MVLVGRQVDGALCGVPRRGVNSHLVTASPRSRRQAAMGAIPLTLGRAGRRAAGHDVQQTDKGRIGDPRARLSEKEVQEQVYNRLVHRRGSKASPYLP